MSLEKAVEDSNLPSVPSLAQKTGGQRVSCCLSLQEELQAEQFWTGQCDPPSPEQATAASVLPGLKGQREGGEGARLCGGESGGEGATPEFHTVGLKRQALSCLFNHGKPRPSGHPKTLSARSPCPGLIGPPEAEVTTSMV